MNQTPNNGKAPDLRQQSEAGKATTLNPKRIKKINGKQCQRAIAKPASRFIATGW